MKIIIHSSESTYGNAACIDGIHSKNWGRNKYGVSIGYHFIILNGQITWDHYNQYMDGNIETGRGIDGDPVLDVTEFGAHTYGQNKNAVGICLIGKNGRFTKKQLENLFKLLRQLDSQYGGIEIFQHSDFDKINRPYCAGLDTGKLREEYNNQRDQINVEYN